MEQITQFGPERRKRCLLQLLVNDTPTVPEESDQWFCILLLRLKTPVEDLSSSALEQLGRYEPVLEQILAELSPSAIPVQYGAEYLVLFSGQGPSFPEDSPDILRAFLEALGCQGFGALCWVASPPVCGVSLIPRAYRIAKTELELRMFRRESPRVFLTQEHAQGGEEALSMAGKDTERRFFLKLVNLDFDGAAVCVTELFTTVGQAGNRDVSLMKLRLFCLLENAAYFLAFRAGKDQSMSDVTPRFLGEFLSATDVERLSQQTLQFIALLEQEFSPSDSSVSLLINKMLGYFSDHYMDAELTVASAAAHFYMSPQQLARDFKKLVGVSPSNYLRQIRLDRAKQLLLDTAMSNEQIAAHVGFGNVKRFYRALQNLDGVSPGQFRRSRGTAMVEPEGNDAVFQNRTFC